MSHLLLILLLLVTTTVLSTEAVVRHYKWNLAYEFKSPDCHRKLMYTINGQSPGPAIVAHQGDTVIVEVYNGLLTENTAIHWHGIHQFGTPWSDGTEGVTQCPIMPGQTFIYKFVVDRAGTYMYHAHYGMQRSAGLNGLIKVLVPEGTVEPFKYDYDRSIIVNDWWHASVYEIATGMLEKPTKLAGEPQSLLINGKGRYDCSKLPTGKCNATNPDCALPVFTVVPGKTYRFRIVSVASESSLNFGFEGHKMTVVEADGSYVAPFTVTDLTIYSGETYSVLITADQNPSRNYWAYLNVVAHPPETATATAILNYYPNNPSLAPPTTPPLGQKWNDEEARVKQSKAIKAHPDHIHPPPKKADRTIILLNTLNLVDGYEKWALNNVSFALPETPYLVSLKYKLNHAYDQYLPDDSYDYKNFDIFATQANPNTKVGNGIYRLEFNTTVDVVLQNANMLNLNHSETHPWHLHGHDFWVLGYGSGKFDPEVDTKKFNLVDPIQKNTVPVHPFGWTAFRFRTNNPGVWAFHCHVEAHFFLGMGVVFESGSKKVGKLPRQIMGCGESKYLIK